MRAATPWILAISFCVLQPGSASALKILDQCEKGDLAKCGKIIRSKTGYGKIERASAYYFRGLAQKKAEDNDAALADFSAAIDLIPKFWEALGERCSVNNKLGNFDRAVADCDAAIALNRSNPQLYRFLGFSHINMKQYDRSVRDFTAAIKLSGKSFADYFNRGLSHAELDQRQAAIDDYYRAIDLKPDYAAAYNNLGVEFLYKKYYDLAIEQFKETLRIDPEHKFARRNLDRAMRGRDQAREEARQKEVEKAKRQAEAAKRTAEEERRRKAEAAEQARRQQERQLAKIREERTSTCASGPATNAAQEAVGLRLDVGFAIEIGEYKDALAGLKALEKTCVSLEAEDLRNAAVIYYQTCDNLRALDAGNRFVESFGSGGKYAAEVQKVLAAIGNGELADDTCD